MPTSVTEDRSTMRPESDGLDPHSKCVTILLADAVVGSTTSLDQNGDSSKQGAINVHNEVAARVIRQHDGQVIRKSDGSVLAEFADPAAAVHAGVEIERLLAASSSRASQPGLRIGIFSLANAPRGIDAFVNAIRVAGRITREAGAGQVLISRECQEAASGERDLKCQWFRRVRIDSRKGKDEDIFEVDWAQGPSGLPSRYKVLSRVGSGGMGIVYKAHDTETDEIVALKTLKPGLAMPRRCRKT